MSASTNFARVKDIESAANKSKAKYTELSNAIGTLASLGTTNKSSLVEAINEVASNAGELTSETWSFTLDDGADTVVNKEVALWI